MTPDKHSGLHPSQFTVNHTWLAFRINQQPIVTDEGEFDIFILQDAASMYILGNAFAKHGAESPAEVEVAVLMQQGWQERQEWPHELLLVGRPSKANAFARFAIAQGIAIRGVPEAQMSLYIKDVQTSFEAFQEGKR